MDSVAQCHMPFVVLDSTSGEVTALNNTANYAELVADTPLRYVLTDNLARLCADLAYSKGAGTVTCADLLHVPAETLWVEWCTEPWTNALQRYGFPLIPGAAQWDGRRGALVHSSRDGRRGLVRTFWSVGADVLASSVEAYFDFDTAVHEEPQPLDLRPGSAGGVYDSRRSDDDVLSRCFRFRYEQSWSEYYASASLSSEQRAALWRHALGTIAMDIPILLTFFLLLATRHGLPQRAQQLGHLNRRRVLRRKAPLLDHIEARAPVFPEYRDCQHAEPQATRMSPRLHHVRGHLVRRGSQIFWRVPHLRGSARSGVVRARTVTWTFDRLPSFRPNLSGTY